MRAKALEVVKALQSDVARRKRQDMTSGRAGAMSKWHLWKKYRDSGHGSDEGGTYGYGAGRSRSKKDEMPVFDWMGKTNGDVSVGWGRRIYDKAEIEVRLYVILLGSERVG